MALADTFTKAEELIKELVPKLRQNETQLTKGDFRKLKEPFNPIYADSVKQLYRIKPHSSTEYYPADLFARLSPHRQNEEAEWIRENYEPVTLPVYMDFQSTLKRGFNRSNYKIIWDDKTIPSEFEGENDPKQYLEDGIKLYGSIHTWFSSVLPDVKMKDANGVIAVRPYSIPLEQNEEGELMISSTEMIEPIPVYYSSEQIMMFEEDEFYLMMSHERSALSGKKTGYVFDYYDKNTILQIRQTGAFSDWTFEYIEYFTHDWESVPVWKLKGQPEMKGRHMYFQSPFDFAVGNLNLALKNQINKQMAEANSAWPHKIMIAQPCNHTGDNNEVCRVGKIWSNSAFDGAGGDITCPKCKGTGIQDKPSPGSTMMVDESQLSDNGIGLQRIAFVSPSSDILNHLADTIVTNMNGARDILHIYSTNNQSAGQKDTATGKWIDNNAMIAFIMPIVNECFEIYEGVIQAMLVMRYGKSVPSPEILVPTDYDYRTSTDMLFEYTSALENNAPPVVLYKLLEGYIEKMFFATGQDANIFKLILSADSVVTKKDDEVRNMVGAGTLPKWRAILHNSVFSFINELMSEDENFFEKDISEQRELLYAKARAQESEITTVANPLDAIFSQRVTQ